MPFAAYFLPRASVFAVFFNSCANKTYGLGRLQWQKKYYSPQSHESEFYEVDNIDHHLTLENCLVKFTYTFRKFLFLLHFTIPLVGPGSHPRGKPRTCALL